MKMKWKSVSVVFSILSVCGIPACSDDTEEKGEGTLSMTLWGEEYIEQGLPNEIFADGYSVTYSKFLIALSDISAAEEGASPAFTAPEMKIWDMTKTGPVTILSKVVPAGEYTRTAYRISPAGDDAVSGNAEAADVQMMIDEELSVYVEGTATDGTKAVSFAWGFNTDTTYDPCHSEGALSTEGEAGIQITIHGDHLLYDSAVSEDPDLRFNDIALADADADGVVTEEELLAYDITALPNYVVGSLEIDNMYDYIAHMTSTLGHIDGEGHCEFR